MDWSIYLIIYLFVSIIVTMVMIKKHYIKSNFEIGFVALCWPFLIIVFTVYAFLCLIGIILRPIMFMVLGDAAVSDDE